MTRIRTASLVVAGLLLLVVSAESEAQARDTSAARARTLPVLTKVKTPPAAATAKAARAAARDVASLPILPPKTKGTAATPAADRRPAVKKPAKRDPPSN